MSRVSLKKSSTWSNVVQRGEIFLQTNTRTVCTDNSDVHNFLVPSSLKPYGYIAKKKAFKLDPDTLYNHPRLSCPSWCIASLSFS